MKGYQRLFQGLFCQGLVLGSLLGMTGPVIGQVVSLGELPVSGQVTTAGCNCGGGQAWASYGAEPLGADMTGSCDSCGIGGYFGRGIYPVAPCACGGSLLADMLVGVKQVLDRTAGCVLGTVFGGLRSMSCHASGSFAALQCAAQSGCATCGGSCSGTCNAVSYDSSYVPASSGMIINGSVVPSSTPTMAAPVSPIPTAPLEPVPAVENPFQDDPTPAAPQANRKLPMGYRVYNGKPLRTAQKGPGKRGGMVQQASHSAPVTSRPAKLRR